MENGNPEEIKDMVKIPSLQAEGENLDVTPLQTEPKITSAIPTAQEETQDIGKNTPNSEGRNLRTKPFVDYKKLENPNTRTPSLQYTPSPSQSPAPPDITRPTETSKAKSKSQEKANLALEKLFENLILDDQDYSFRASDHLAVKTGTSLKTILSLIKDTSGISLVQVN